MSVGGVLNAASATIYLGHEAQLSTPRSKLRQNHCGWSIRLLCACIGRVTFHAQSTVFASNGVCHGMNADELGMASPFSSTSYESNAFTKSSCAGCDHILRPLLNAVDLNGSCVALVTSLAGSVRLLFDCELKHASFKPSSSSTGDGRGLNRTPSLIERLYSAYWLGFFLIQSYFVFSSLVSLRCS